MDFIKQPTRNLFFTGKGGVGKTSLACATAVALADRGKRVLLVSTDPASNLDEVLGTKLGHQPTPVPGVPRLWALNIDPEAAATIIASEWSLPTAAFCPMRRSPAWKSSSRAPARWRSPPSTSSPDCWVTRQATTDFDHVIFDTAPTGHTLRLLTLPSAWDGFMTRQHDRHFLPGAAGRAAGPAAALSQTRYRR